MYKKYGMFPIGDTIRSVCPWWHNHTYEAREKYHSLNGGPDSHVAWPAFFGYLKNEYAKTVDNIKGALESGGRLSQLSPIKPVWGDMSHIRLIHAIITNRPETDILSIPNRGVCSDLPDNVAVNIKVLPDGNGLHGARPAVKVNRRVLYNVYYPRIRRCSNYVGVYQT